MFILLDALEVLLYSGAIILGVAALAVIAHIPVTDRQNIKIALVIFFICLFIFYILSKYYFKCRNFIIIKCDFAQ